jgi:hypothetical protein
MILTVIIVLYLYRSSAIYGKDAIYYRNREYCHYIACNNNVDI